MAIVADANDLGLITTGRLTWRPTCRPTEPGQLGIVSERRRREGSSLLPFLRVSLCKERLWAQLRAPFSKRHGRQESDENEERLLGIPSVQRFRCCNEVSKDPFFFFATYFFFFVLVSKERLDTRRYKRNSSKDRSDVKEKSPFYFEDGTVVLSQEQSSRAIRRCFMKGNARARRRFILFPSPWFMRRG